MRDINPLFSICSLYVQDLIPKPLLYKGKGLTLLKVDSGHHRKPEYVTAWCKSTCSRSHCIQGASEMDGVLHRTCHVTLCYYIYNYEMLNNFLTGIHNLNKNFMNNLNSFTPTDFMFSVFFCFVLIIVSCDRKKIPLMNNPFYVFMSSFSFICQFIFLYSHLIFFPHSVYSFSISFFFFSPANLWSYL